MKYSLYIDAIYACSDETEQNAIGN